jgi:hypothetical protein
MPLIHSDEELPKDDPNLRSDLLRLQEAPCAGRGELREAHERRPVGRVLQRRSRRHRRAAARLPPRHSRGSGRTGRPLEPERTDLRKSASARRQQRVVSPHDCAAVRTDPFVAAGLKVESGHAELRGKRPQRLLARIPSAGFDARDVGVRVPGSDMSRCDRSRSSRRRRIRWPTVSTSREPSFDRSRSVYRTFLGGSTRR